MKRKKIILLVVLLMAVGFAAVSTTLYINGQTKINANQDDFNVYYSDAKVNGVQDHSVIADDTHISFTTTLETLGEKYVLDYNVTNGSKNYDAELSMTCTTGNEYLTVTNEFDDDAILETLQTRSGKLTLELVQSYAGENDIEVTIDCTISANATERDSLGEGEANVPASEVFYVGKEVSIGTENFYVMSQTEETVTMLAKYNLSVGNVCSVPPSVSCTALENTTGIQDSNMIGGIVSGPSAPLAYGTTPYSSADVKGTNYADYSGSIVEGYVNDYVSYLNSNYNINVSGRLLLKADFDELAGQTVVFNGSPVVFKNLTSLPSWVYSTSYWMGEASFTSNVVANSSPFVINSNSYLQSSNYNTSYYYGVRPVITITKADFNSL